MTRTAVIAATATLFVGVGVASVFTMPAGAESAKQAQARLDSVPLEVGAWVGADVPPTEQHTKYMKVAEADASLNRLYTHATTKQVVAVSILYGNQGAMCAHDPNTCYAGSGFNASGAAVPKSFPTADATLKLGRFEKGDPAPTGLDVCWGFTADGGWQAPDSPRLAFAGRSMLYKLYAQTGVPVGVHRPDADDPLLEFLTVFLPKLRVALTAE